MASQCESVKMSVMYPSSSAMKMIRLSKTAAANTSNTSLSVRQLNRVPKFTCSSQESSGRVRLKVYERESQTYQQRFQPITQQTGYRITPLQSASPALFSSEVDEKQVSFSVVICCLLSTVL